MHPQRAHRGSPGTGPRLWLSGSCLRLDAGHKIINRGAQRKSHFSQATLKKSRDGVFRQSELRSSTLPTEPAHALEPGGPLFGLHCLDPADRARAHGPKTDERQDIALEALETVR